MNKAPVQCSYVPDPLQLSTSHWFEFETEVLSQEESLDGLSRINRDLLEQIAAMGSPQRVLLDIDGQTPVCGEQQPGSCNTHADPTDHHPFLQFNGEGDCQAENLRPENVPSADHCDEAPLPEIEHCQERSLVVVVRNDAGFAKPETHETLGKPEAMQTFPTDNSSVPERPNEPAIDRARGTVMAVGRELPAPWQQAEQVTTAMQQFKRIRPRKPWWMAVAAVVTALGVALIAYSIRHPASPLGAELQKSNTIEQQAPFVSRGELPTNSTTTPLAVPIAPEKAKVAKPGHPRVRIRGNEVDIGEDVTVRYLAPQQAVVPPTGTVPTESQPADASLPEAEVSSSPELAR
jgi:hypothetical protein